METLNEKMINHLGVEKKLSEMSDFEKLETLIDIENQITNLKQDIQCNSLERILIGSSNEAKEKIIKIYTEDQEQLTKEYIDEYLEDKRIIIESLK